MDSAAASVPPTGLPTKRQRLRSKTRIADSPELEVEAEVEAEVEHEPMPPMASHRYAPNTRWEWFAVHVADSDFKFRLSVALELKSKQAQKARQAVEWGTLRELPDGFVLQWVSPALIRAGHMWWARIIEKVPGSKTVQWRVQGYHVDPGAACPGQQPIPEAMASSAAAVPPPAHPPALPRAAEEQALAAPAWPKFLVRRLIAGWSRHASAEFGRAASEYKLHEFIGKGGYAKVYRDDVNGQPVAVKCFSAKKSIYAVQEASIAERLGAHPHLPCLLDAVRLADERALLVYAFVGRSLHTLVEDRQLRPDHISTCMAHLLKGLSHMHGVGLCHFDVKPRNVLMAADPNGLEPRFVLIDLGSAVEVGFGVPTRLGFVATTLWYKSPEMLDGRMVAEGEAWMRSDVWAAGITLAEMCRLDFFKVDTLRRDALRVLRKEIRDALEAGAPGWDRFVRDTVGAIGG